MKTQKSELETQMYAIIEEWQNSNDTLVNFCKIKGISHHSFNYWRKKQKKYANPFREVTPKSTDLPSRLGSMNAYTLQISYPNGVRI